MTKIEDKAMKAVVHKTGQKAVTSTMRKGAAAINPAECIREIATAYSDYKKIAQQEKTKRQQIKAWEKVSLRKIKAQRDLLMEYLDRSFDERKSNFEHLFQSLDESVRNGDTQSTALFLKSIVDLAQSSPFKDIASAETIRGVLEDPNKDFEF